MMRGTGERRIWGTSFPDIEYLASLVAHKRAEMEERLEDNPIEQLLMYAGVDGNWTKWFITDEEAIWEKRVMPIDKLTLTGRHPEWYPLIDDCGGSPAKLRQLLAEQSELKERFASAYFVDIPIMVYFEDGEYRIFDGMHRAIGAMLEGHNEIEVWIVRPGPNGHRPQCEPHVVNDLIKTLFMGMEADRDDLVAALRLIKTHYANGEDLLREWENDKKESVRGVIRRALED